MESITGIGNTAHTYSNGTVGIGWTSNGPVSMSISVQGSYQQIGTSPGVVDVSYYDPEIQSTVVESFPLTDGTTRIQITTGVPLGSPLSMGEVKVTPVAANASLPGTGSAARALMPALGPAGLLYDFVVKGLVQTGWFGTVRNFV